ncbi:MAG: CRISPR-associated endonuclease Cas4g/Cas1g [Roseimicrobium sp.]
MNAPLQTRDAELAPHPPLPVRRLHNYLYCPRLFYYQWVENLFEENADTVAGSRTHRKVDAPSRMDDEKQKALSEGLAEGARLRSLKLESEALGLLGVVDIVEGGPDGAEVLDYKKGSARRTSEGERVAKEPDAAQVAAYVLLLREQGIHAVRAWVYYAEDRRRVPVELTEQLFQKVRDTVVQAKALAASGHCPPPLKNDARCLYCSAYPICLPQESAWWAVAARKPIETEPQMTFVFAREDRATPGQAELHFAEPAPSLASTKELEPPDIKQPPRPEHDEGEVLVVQTAGAQVGQRGGEITVSVKGEVVVKKPLQQVRSIYLYGAVQVTAQAAETCLEQGIAVAYFSPAGRYLGALLGLPASGVDARRGQYRLFEQESIRLLLAREAIRAKIHNQRVMLMRNGEVPDHVLKLMATCREETARAGDLTTLMGIEGTAAALYFEHFPGMLKGGAEWKFDWTGRNRRPPRDPVNALLSMGYSMLAKEITGVCHAVGLDPFLGFLHQPRYGRPALALDLMEEFRPLVADSVAISLINRGEVTPQDFIRSASGTFLNDAGRRAFWESWFRRMDTEVSHPEFGYKMTYRRMFEVQARQLWRFLRGEASGYHAFTTR